MVVLEPLFWDQSMNTLLARSVFFMSLTRQIRVVCSSAAGQFVGEVGDLVRALRPVQGGVEVDALAAAGHRARGPGPRPAGWRGPAATSTHSASPHPRPGSRSSTSRSGRHARSPCGVAPATAARGFPGRRSGPARSSVAGSLTSGYWIGPVRVRDGGAGHPAGRRVARFFWKNISRGRRRSRPRGPALPGGRPVPGGAGSAPARPRRSRR